MGFLYLLLIRDRHVFVCVCHRVVFPFYLLNQVISFHKNLCTRYVSRDFFNLVIINVLKWEILTWTHEHHDVGRHYRHCQHGLEIMHGMVTACGI
jgi:hypothetical protein